MKEVKYYAIPLTENVQETQHGNYISGCLRVETQKGPVDPTAVMEMF